MTQDAIYDSAKRFEDLPLSPELLKVHWVGNRRDEQQQQQQQQPAASSANAI